jgi:hypothetical protein
MILWSKRLLTFPKIIQNFMKLQHFMNLIGKMLILRMDTCLVDMLVMAFTTKCANEKCIIQKMQKIVNVNFVINKILTTTI